MICFPDKHTSNKKETVWDRLSKVQKVPSTENTLGISRSRQNLAMKTSKRFQTTRPVIGNQPQQVLQQTPIQQIVNRKPLSPNACSLNGRGNPPKKVRLSKANVLPEIENQRFVYVCKHNNKLINEIMSARSLSNSKTSSDDNKTSDRLFATDTAGLTRLNFQADCEQVIAATANAIIPESTDDSNDDYKLAPLMSSRSYHDSNTSIKIVNYVRGFLKNNDTCMASEDIELVNDVIKSDRRYRDLNECNPKLFKDILITQLQGILKHEFALKSALDKLDSSADLQCSQQVQTMQTMQSAEDILSSAHINTKELQKLEVDVIFKNVPSLEKEIIILRALGEKLEATLKSSSSHREVVSRKTQESLALSSKTSELFMVHEIYELAIEHCVQVKVRSLGICYLIGIVKEFCIAEKTIDELQQDLNRPFYIPINPATAELKRTSFKKLKENPDILLRHIKPKNSVVAFNVLEQDPVFFNNIIFSKAQTISKLSLAVSTNDDYYAENDLHSAPLLFEGGDSCFRRENEDHTTSRSPLQTKAIPKQQELAKLECDHKQAKESVKSMKRPKLMESPIRGQQRRRTRYSMTPMSSQKTQTPKNSLLKTILVGSVQLHLFLLLIMAFTFPDPKC